VDPKIEKRSTNLFEASHCIVVAQSFPNNYLKLSSLGIEYTPIRVMEIRSMDEALETWRNLHDIDEKAYNQLRVLLFRQPLKIAHFVDNNHVNLSPTRSTLNDTSIFSPGLFEISMQNGRLSNTNLGPGLLETSMPNEGFWDADLSPALLESHMPNGGFSNTSLRSELLETNMPDAPALLESHMPNGEFSNIDLGPALLETDMPDVGFWDAGLPPALLESHMPNEGFSNTGLGPSLLEISMPDEGLWDAGLPLALLESHMPNGGFSNECPSN